MEPAQSPALAQGCAAQQKSCAACGEKFGCSGSSGPCWCREVKVSAEILAALRARYADCLCPRCLGSAAGAADADAKRTLA